MIMYIYIYIYISVCKVAESSDRNCMYI